MSDKAGHHRCHYCRRFLSVKDILSGKLPKVYTAHWMPAADGEEYDEYAHEKCQSKYDFCMENYKKFEDDRYNRSLVK